MTIWEMLAADYGRWEQFSPKPAGIAVNTPEQCRQYAQLCVRFAWELDRVRLDYTDESLERLDTLIGGGGDLDEVPTALILAIGAYLGETVIQEIGGEWNWHGPFPGPLPTVDIAAGTPDTGDVFVIHKAAKRLENGMEDSLASLLKMTRHLKEEHYS